MTLTSSSAADLVVHHTIEERHIFPVLAKRMPAFKENDVHIASHHGIHEGCVALMRFWPPLILCALGLDKLGELLKKWTAEPAAYSPQEMKDCLDSWREVLFKHLDEEASTLLAQHQLWQRPLLYVYKFCAQRPVIEQPRRSLAPPHCPLARPLEDLTRPRSSVSNCLAFSRTQSC